jgi:DNA anti-recombination protein RmuC
MKRSVYNPASMYRMAWTDDRLQERFDSIDRRFDEVDRRFEQVDRRFDKVDERFDKVDGELGRINSRIDGLQRTIMQIGGGIIATLVAGIFGVIATQL